MLYFVFQISKYLHLSDLSTNQLYIRRHRVAYLPNMSAKYPYFMSYNMKDCDNTSRQSYIDMLSGNPQVIMQCNPQMIQWIRYKKKERWHCMVGHNKVTIFFLKTKDLINTEGLFLIILFFLYTLYKCLAFSLPLLNNLNANITRDSWTISLTLATRTSLWPKQLFSLDST